MKKTADDADAVVPAIGRRAGWFGTRITEGEGTDVARVELPEHQVEPVRAVGAAGKPMIGVLYQGRPYPLAEVEPRRDSSRTTRGPRDRGITAAR
ncbi:glycoside hydrolase family 3 C-terminal domain-containing protein [Streptomyces sp. NPDC002172]